MCCRAFAAILLRLTGAQATLGERRQRGEGMRARKGSKGEGLAEFGAARQTLSQESPFVARLPFPSSFFHPSEPISFSTNFYTFSASYMKFDENLS